ncbi:methyltransferase type 12 [Cellulomonas bogoriensis 69B4 = DSM 16987]|uniref:Methyltransferase type 12 n=1 Tax=Cellulomonas bogoriensis 69B4 = DSM 16987 TaxID=1386082 RepID=A0A0A0BVC0_9CELL|nr:methyltransferase type 12 [Cellulomonas bogoriensis 69B4 = DSM 16987]
MIEPDTKDWTWVLHQRCEDCGFEPDDVIGPELPVLIHEWVPRWESQLGRPDVRRRPRPDVWSPLEYACHVRDVFRIFDERLAMMLVEDDPTFPNWDQDATALSERYDQQAPSAVAEELRDAGADLAAGFAAVRREQWERRGLRSNGSAFTVRTLGRYFAHDVVHHLHDVTH